MEKEKIKKMNEMELRYKEIMELKSVGADASHLEVRLFIIPVYVLSNSFYSLSNLKQIPTETTFQVIIEKGVLNLLNEEHRLTDEPGKYAFGRLFFEVFMIILPILFFCVYAGFC